MKTNKTRKTEAPKSQPKIRLNPRLAVILIAIVASILILSNLANSSLWQDEAQTALISKTVLTQGTPHAYDGKNYFSQEAGKECDSHYVYNWHPWLPFYVLAAFFAILGTSTFVARLPFALFGIATVVLTYYYALAVFRSRRVAALSAMALTISVPFLLLTRQCRYYAPDMFFSVLALYAYNSVLESEKRSIAGFFVAAMLLFHVEYVHCAVILAVACLHALIFKRDKLLALSLTCAAVFAVNVPWIIRFSQATAGVNANIAAIGSRFLSFVGQVFNFTVYKGLPLIPLWLLLPIAVALAVRWYRGTSPASNGQALHGIVLFGLFVTLSIVSSAIASAAPFFRYLAPIIPVCCIVVGLIINAAAEVHISLGIAVLAALIYFSPMTDYLYEITHNFYGPVEGIVKFLNKNARQGDTVAITYGDLPLKFYTNLRVVGGLTGESLKPADTAKWIIIRKHVVSNKDYSVAVYLQDLLRSHPMDYEETILDCPDTTFENRESPDEHYFRTVTNADPVAIFERTAK